MPPTRKKRKKTHSVPHDAWPAKSKAPEPAVIPASAGWTSLTPELLGTITTFLDLPMPPPPPATKQDCGEGKGALPKVDDENLPGELMSLCIVVGPKMAASIRRTYLRDNDRFLLDTMQLARPELNVKGRQNVRRWMEANPDWKDRCSDPARGKEWFGQSIALTAAHAKEVLEFELVGGRFLRLKSVTSRNPLAGPLVGQYLISVTNWRGQFGSIRGMSFEDILEEFKVESSSSGSRQVATSRRSSRLRLVFVRRPDVVFSNPVIAAELGLTEIVKFLIEEKGLDVNGSWIGIGISFPGNTLLLTSLLASTDISVLRYLLTVPGADFDFRIKEGALIHRVIGENLRGKLTLDRLEALLGHGTVDINARTTRGWTALHIACEKSWIDAEVVYLLLQYGANIHSRPTDVGGWTRETPIETLSSIVVQCVYAHKKDENRSKKIHLLVKASGAKSSGELGRMFPLLGRASAYDSAQALWSFYLEQSAANGERAPLRRSKRRVVS